MKQEERRPVVGGGHAGFPCSPVQPALGQGEGERLETMPGGQKQDQWPSFKFPPPTCVKRTERQQRLEGIGAMQTWAAGWAVEVDVAVSLVNP